MLDADMRYHEFYNTILQKAATLKIDIATAMLEYSSVSYKSIRLSRIKKDQPILLMTAGFHGNEPAGPLAILDSLEEIVERSKRKKVSLIIYPCINPSGFDWRLRYNIDDDTQSTANNDFIRYITGKKIVSELKDGKYSEWFYSNDMQLNGSLPAETRHMHAELKNIPLDRIDGSIDLHQDCCTDEPCTFVYAFEDLPIYRKAMKKAKKIAPALKNAFIDTGYNPKPEKLVLGGIKYDQEPDESDKYYSDKHGFVNRYDGSITDFMHKIGTTYSVAVETSASTPLEDSFMIYRLWIKEIMNAIPEIKKI